MPTDGLTVLVVVHQQDLQPGVLEAAIRGRGDRLLRWDVRLDSEPPPPDAYDAVVLLGGPMHATDDDLFPWLKLERAMVGECLERRTPVLGICLGAQVLARVVGARIEPAREPEIGWREVTLTQAGEEDPLLGSLPRRAVAFQWHVDTFEIGAPHATLARSATCQQAFRVEDVAWGVQFHPEVTPRIVRDWVMRAAHDLSSVACSSHDLARARRLVQRYAAEWERIGRELFDCFLDVAAGRREAGPPSHAPRMTVQKAAR